MIEIKSHGLHWRNDNESNFSGLTKKKGIYVLEYNFDVVYIGKAEKSLINRLKRHNNNHHQGRWNMFSWFELNVADNIDFKNLISTIEILCIAIAEPKLNGQTTSTKLGERKYQQKLTSKK